MFRIFLWMIVSFLSTSVSEAQMVGHSTDRQYVSLTEYNSLKHQQEQMSSILTSLIADNRAITKSVDDILKKYAVLESGLSSVLNKTMYLERKVSQSEALSNGTTVLQDLQHMKLQIQSIGAKTFMLDSNERARNHDIVALYNKTTKSEQMILDLEAESIKRFHQMDHDQNETILDIQRQLYDICLNTNVTVADVLNKLEAVDTRHGTTERSLEMKMKDYEQKANVTEQMFLRATNDQSEY